ncbi:hypothetical protein JCM16303_005405 [Sporobolomyces ruberrimus]
MNTQVLLDLLPQDAPGNLPYWMLFVSSLAIFNSVQNFLTTSLTRKVYARSPAWINPLQARTFGIWTLTSAFIRLYASYNISNKPLFDLALISYGIAWFHFVSEFLFFGTAGTKGAISPFIVSTTSLIWMWKRSFTLSLFFSPFFEKRGLTQIGVFLFVEYDFYVSV